MNICIVNFLSDRLADCKIRLICDGPTLIVHSLQIFSVQFQQTELKYLSDFTSRRINSLLQFCHKPLWKTSAHFSSTR